MRLLTLTICLATVLTGCTAVTVQETHVNQTNQLHDTRWFTAVKVDIDMYEPPEWELDDGEWAEFHGVWTSEYSRTLLEESHKRIEFVSSDSDVEGGLVIRCRVSDVQFSGTLTAYITIVDEDSGEVFLDMIIESTPEDSPFETFTVKNRVEQSIHNVAQEVARLIR